MRFDGILKTWNDDRGFGFITPTQGGDDIFVHISAFPAGARPILNEPLSFEIDHNREGKKRAVQVLRTQRAAAAATPALTQQEGRPRRSYAQPVVALALVACLVGYGYSAYSKRVRQIAHGVKSNRSEDLAPPPGARCDGRIYCSQMTSCSEATFFLRNCPGVEMDGDGDGVPCERQWCAGQAAR